MSRANSICTAHRKAGSGKTRKLLELFIDMASIVGPERVAAVTYTRAGASVLRERVGAALGISGNDAELARKIPWVGTIHSMALRLSGESRSRVIDKVKLKKFAPDFDGYLPSPEYMDTLSLDEPTRNSDEIETMLWCLSASRHRMIPFEDVFELLDPHVLARVSTERIQGLALEYTAWKQQQGYLDFEDMLDLGKQARLPVKALLCDEVQDNTPLLYSVLQAWEQPTEVSVFAGDFYQAIYHFAGASPDLFKARPGTWTTIGNSHRFDQRTADYARLLIESVYGADPQLHTWEGVGGEEREQGTEFYLARTNGLVAEKEKQLQDDGVAYHRMRGLSPLQQKSGDVYRAALLLRRGDLVPHTSVVTMALKLGGRVQLAEARALPSGQYGLDTVQQIIGSLDLALENLDYYTYFAQIERRDGELALFRKPKLSVGTIHSSKGLEADKVTVCTSWATRPAANLSGGQRKPETCIAYVACSRHRHELVLEPCITGTPYPFPSRR